MMEDIPIEMIPDPPEDTCPKCGGILIEDDDLCCQECDWCEDNELDEEE
jgi:hypothetical protein